MNWIYEPWPWYVAGPLLGLIVLILLLSGQKFGVSSNLRTICTICGAGNSADFFKFDWKSQIWNLIVLLGTVVGGALAVYFLSGGINVAINPATVESLSALGIENAGNTYLPTELFNFSNLKSMGLLAIGGFLVGFGARYAGGCTSGHAISGLSDLQLPSLIAVIGFFIGGLVMIHFVFPILF